MKRMTKEQFNKWAVGMYNEYVASSYCSTRCNNGNTVICFSKHGNKIGKATCHKDDEFKYYIGAAIAYARATGKEVPTIIEEINIKELKYGDNFICDGETYTYIAQHPLDKIKHVVVKKNYPVSCLMSWTKVEKI